MKTEGVYAIEWQSGVTKVGRSDNWVARQVYYLDERPDDKVKRSLFVQTDDSRAAESRALKLLKADYPTLPGRREWFLANFDAASEAVREATRNEPTPVFEGALSPVPPSKSLLRMEDQDGAVADYIRRHPAESGRQIAAGVGVAVSTVSKALRRLSSARRIRSEAGPRNSKLWRLA